MSSSSERVQAGASMGMSAALPVASVIQCRVKPSPCTATVTPSMGADWRAARSGCGEFRCFSWRYAPLLVKVCFCPSVFRPAPGRAWQCTPQIKKPPEGGRGERVIWRCPWQGRRRYFFAERQGFLPCRCRQAGAAPQRCRPGQKRRWWGRP